MVEETAVPVEGRGNRVPVECRGNQSTCRGMLEIFSLNYAFISQFQNYLLLCFCFVFALFFLFFALFFCFFVCLFLKPHSFSGDSH